MHVLFDDGRRTARAKHYVLVGWRFACKRSSLEAALISVVCLA